MSFEPLKRRLIDRKGHEVSESIQIAVLHAFEHALGLPDANIDRLIAAARRVVRVIADGTASTPDAMRLRFWVASPGKVSSSSLHPGIWTLRPPPIR